MGFHLFFSYVRSNYGTFHIAHIIKILRTYEEIEKIYCYQDVDFSDIYDYIDEYIKKSDALILFCSKESEDNDWVKMEWKGALDIKKIIVPIFKDSKYVPIPLRGKLRVELNEDEIETTANEIYNILIKAFKLKPNKKKEKIEEYKEPYLPLKEVKALSSLVRLMNYPFEIVEHIDEITNKRFKKIGIVIERNNIIAFGLNEGHLNFFPESLKKIKNLGILVLSALGLKSIPEWIIELKKLDFLDLSYNKLNKLPDYFVDLKYLGVLDLSDNALQKLPNLFGNMGFEYLFLENNQLKTLPISFLNIEAIQITLNKNPLEEKPDLQTRFIIEYLRNRNSIEIVVDLPKFKFFSDITEKNSEVSSKTESLIQEYLEYDEIYRDSEKFMKISEDIFVDPEESWKVYETKKRKIEILNEIMTLGYPAVDYLMGVYLEEDKRRSVAGYILDYIFENIEPNWKEYLNR